MPVSRLSRIVLGLLLALPVPAPPSPARAQAAELSKAEEYRLRQEAKGLFEAVLAEPGPAPGTCGLDKEWASRLVPYRLARKHLGHTALADLNGLETGATTAEILDSPGKHPEWFCGVEEFRRELQGRKDKTLAAGRAGEGADSLRGSMPQLDFSFPVFDMTFRTAIVVRSSSYYGWFMRDGQLQQSLALFVDALVYRKTNGRWRLVEDERLFSAE